MKIKSLEFKCTKIEELNKLSQFVDLEVLILKLNINMESDAYDIIKNINLPLGIKKIYVYYLLISLMTNEQMKLFAFDIFTYLKIPFGCEVKIIFKRVNNKYLFRQEDDIIKCTDLGESYIRYKHIGSNHFKYANNKYTLLI